MKYIYIYIDDIKKVQELVHQLVKQSSPSLGQKKKKKKLS